MPETANELLIKLKNLRVQEEEVIQQIERAVQQDRADREQQTKQESFLDQSISEEQKQAQAYKPGDRVRIKNRVTLGTFSG